MDKIKLRVLKVSEPGFIHDSRKDVKTLAKMVNLLIDKVNGLIDENKVLNERLHRIANNPTNQLND